jgi:tRNA A-37 threonylcarbamoyl transferase component Bud32
LERIWEDLPTSTKDPEWKDFWKSLDDWANNNINQGALPKVEWNRMQVAAWARKVLDFSDKSAKILIEQEIIGRRLLRIRNEDAFIKAGLSLGAASDLWAEIEKMKSLAEPVPIEEKFKKLGLIVNHSTSVMLNLHKNGFLRFEPLPLESGEQTSSTWRALCDDLPKVDFDASHIDLMKKVDTLIGKLGVQNTDIRFWLDKGHHKESELYPDLVLSQTPTKKSESKKFAEAASTTKRPHDQLEWHRKLFIIKVAKTNVFNELKSDFNVDKILQSTMKKKVGQLASYMFNNMVASGATESYGAVTCYSHWLFVKAVLIEENIQFFIHNQIEDLLPGNKDLTKQGALKTLLGLLQFVMKASAEPVNLKRFQDDVSPILIRTDNRDIVMVAQVVAKTSRSLVLKAHCPRTKQIICIKCSRGISDSFMTEIDIIKQINRAKVPHVPQLLFTGEVYWHGERMHCFATDLFGECIASVLPLPLSEVQIMAQDVVQALIGMHNLHLVHSDVKPSNIVRVWDSVLQRYKYSLIDFGFSFVEGTVSDGNWGCSVAYASLEMLNGNAPTAKDDLKALWYTVIHALLGSLPWQYLAQFVELTKWAKEGWHDDFAEVKDEQYVNLVSLYNLMDMLPEPHQAWQRYLTAQ